jgi:hypothetical protein
MAHRRPPWPALTRRPLARNSAASSRTGRGKAGIWRKFCMVKKRLLPKRDPVMHPTRRGRRRWLRWLLVCGTAATAIVLIGLVIEAASSPGRKGPGSSVGAVPGGGASSHPAKSAPARQAAASGPPNGLVTVVRGRQVINGVELGFPHSTVGAISAAADVLSEVFTLDPGHAAVVGRLTADSSNPTLPQDAAQGAENLRKDLGVPATGPVPAGYSVHFKAVEYQVRDVTSDEVMVILLSDVTFVQPKVGVRVRIGVYPFLMHWEKNDWKDAGETAPTYVKLAAVPYSSQAAALGWKTLLP